MSQKPKGNLKGLSPSQIKGIQKLFSRSVDRSQLCPRALGLEVAELSSKLGRRIGLLISREGKILEVVVGTREILYLPDLGRYRFGAGRLRRLRLVFGDLSKGDTAQIPHDIYTDLEKLRLDAVVSVKSVSNQVRASYAHLLPLRNEEEAPIETEEVKDLSEVTFPFIEFMEQLEQQLTLSRTRKKSSKEAAVLVGVYDKKLQNVEDSMAELEELARTAGVEIAGKIIQRRTPDPRTLLGKGKLEEVVLRCLRLEAELLIFDTELKPFQWRVITNSTDIKVLDRSMLILDIFAQRATSSDGRLQVELAQLKYNLPRLVEKDAGLSRLTGGIGGRGPGETKLEIGRRRIRDRISDLEKRIDKLGKQREMRRKKRKGIPVPLVAILGYTNAGKSTLFNALTSGSVLAEDKLFATLDPAQKRWVIPGGEEDPTSYGMPLVLTDTVGFIRDLPDELRTAFRATLEELYEANYLLHVVDASSRDLKEKMASVRGVLQEMNLLDTPLITVLNKCDLVSHERLEELVAETEGIAVSAINREGFNELRRRVKEMVTEKDELSH